MSRSSWKTTFINTEFLNAANKIITVYSRSTIIIPEYIGFTAKIYNGIRFYETIINEKMIGHKFGEFSPTRRFPKHKKKK